MRHLTLKYIGNLAKAFKPPEEPRRPLPMPGKRWPTRVAWFFMTGRMPPGGGTKEKPYRLMDVRTHSYLGKPSRYRALEAYKFLQQGRTLGHYVLEMWQAEFDRAGLIASIWQPGPRMAPRTVGSNAFKAYHPHSAQPEILEAFIKPLHLKYVGGMRLYSQKRKLGMDALEFYYNWYYQQFKKKLRKPKAQAMAIVAGELVDAETLEPKAPPAQE